MLDSRRVIQEAMELASAGKAEQAAALLMRMVQREPRNADGLRALAQVLLRAGRLDRALYYAERGVEVRGDGPALMVLSAVRHVRREWKEAAEAAARAAAAAPESFEAHSNLGVCLNGLGDAAGAERAMRRAIEVGPDREGGYANLANLLATECRVGEAIAVLREGAARRPGSAELQRALCFHLNYAGGAAEVRAAQRRMGELMPRMPAFKHANVADPERALRVGFVSPDFQRHVVMRFFEPLLDRMDRGAFAPVCYSTSPVKDEVTERVRARAAGWVDAWGLGDRALAERIVADGIDVLVDLAGFTTGARPGVFCLCPSPVQMGMIGYPGATGLAAIAHRLADEVTDPRGAEYAAGDVPVRLGRCFLCYRPGDAPAVRARRPGPVTFGSFNAASKISAECLALWSRVLERVPGSRLVVKAMKLGNEGPRAWVAARLPAGRVEVRGPSPTEAEHLGAYEEVDVALDTFPYGGTTTTCEALWMGVPVVTLAGELHAGRVGASLLTAVGAGELIARSEEEFVAVAAGLAGDAARLAGYRAGLRVRVEGSELRDEAGYARAVEGAMRGLWREWCAGRGAEN